MNPQTRVIVFIVTEGGYYLNARHQLETSNSDLQAGLQGEYKAIYDTLARIPEKRMVDDAGPLTLFNCDDVCHSSRCFHDDMVESLQLTGKQAVINWMTASTTCPNTMVDRITPRPAVDLSARIKAQAGIDDKAPVMGEAFTQWVVEDHFRDARPNLEVVGVEMAELVTPYEEAKIRTLNTSHSCIAWAGTLIDQQYIHESTLIDAVYTIVDRYVTGDVIPYLGDNGIDLPIYQDVVLKRSTNLYIQDTNQHVAVDGLSKIPAMIAPTLQECYQRGVRPKATVMLPALFFVLMEQWHKGTLPYQYQDDILDVQAVHEIYGTQDPVAIYARDKALFGDLADNTDFLALMRERVAAVYTLIK